MGYIIAKKILLLFLIFVAPFSTSSAGRLQKSMVLREMGTLHEEIGALRHGAESDIHERLLKVKTNDYGRYDPTPALVKPPFKLIPN